MTKSPEGTSAGSAPDRELIITRIFNAPRALVYKAFTDPDQVAQWFGPVGYTVPRETIDMDVRVGGHQRVMMVADDDSYPPGGPVDAVYDEIVENELIVGHEDLEGEMAELFGSARIALRIEFTRRPTTRPGWCCARGRTARTSSATHETAGRARSPSSTSWWRDATDPVGRAPRPHRPALAAEQPLPHAGTPDPTRSSAGRCGRRLLARISCGRGGAAKVPLASRAISSIGRAADS